MLFKSGIKILNNSEIRKLFEDENSVPVLESATDYRLFRTTEECYFCHNCLKLISKEKKCPKMSIHNNLELDEIPPELKKLTDFEHQLISPNLIFIKIFKLPTSRMFAEKGKLVNIPLENVDIEQTLKQVLPRQFDDSYLVPVNLKRKKSMTHSEISQFINPKAMIAAIAKLKQLENVHFKDISIDYDYSLESTQFHDDETINDEDAADEIESEEEDGDNILSGVSEFQSHQTSNVCLIPNEPDGSIVENLTNQTISKKRRMNQKNSVDISPGEFSISSVINTHIIGNKV